MTQTINAIERRAWLAFSLVAILALAIGWLTYANSRRLLDDQDTVDQSHETILALERTLSSLQDVETGARGYVLTGNPEFLKPLASGAEQVAKDLAGLKLLTAADPAQTTQLATLETFAAEKVDISRANVAVRDAESADAARRLVASGRGKAVMDEVRATVATMQDTEEARLRSRTSSSEANTRNTLILTGALAGLSLTLFAILIAAIMRALRVQRRAADANARLSAIVGASSDAVVSLDLERRVASWNPGAEKMFGYSAAEAIGQPISFLAPPDQLPAQSQLAQKLLGGSAAEVVETVRLAKDGRLVEVSISAFPLRDSTGVLTGFGSIAQDISERKRVAAVLAESQQRWRAVFQDSPVAMTLARPSDGSVLDANKAFSDLVGVPRDEVIGRTSRDFLEFVDPTAREEFVSVVNAEGGVSGKEVAARTHDGRRLDVLISVSTVGLGESRRLISICADVTLQKQAERALRDSEARWARLFRSSPVAVSVVRASDFVFLDVNSAWLEMFELDREAVIGRTTLDFGIWADLSERPGVIERLRTESSARNVELRWRTGSGRIIDTLAFWERVQIGGEDCLVRSVIDVTARKQAEENLREAEQRWETVFSTSAVGFTISNADDSVITAANQRFLDLLELPRDEVIGRSAESLGIWVDAGERTAVLDHLHLGDGREVEVRLRARSGRIVHAIVSTVAILLNGRLSRVSNITDVTARVEAERERQRLFDLSPDMLAVAGFDGRSRAVNHAVVETLGYSYEEILAMPFLALMHEDDRDTGIDALARLATAGGPVTFNARLKTKDGRDLRVEFSASADPGGQTLYAVARDVTARWEMAEALREGEERFRSVIETATDAIVITDRFGTIELVNPAAEQMFGYTAAEAIGQDITALIPSEAQEEPGNHIVAFLNKGDSEIPGLRRELVGQRRDGSFFAHELTANAMQLGDQLKFTAIIRDITERKRLEGEIVRARESAEEANRAKSVFLSRMSHELRTPLNVVLGFGQVLQLDRLEPQQTEAVDYILKAGRHLLELIDEVLDISRIEAGRLSLSIEPVHVSETVADILTLMRPLASQRQVTLRAAPEPCDVFVIGDRQRLRQVLLNLVANAIKYNREGGTVDIGCTKADDSMVRIIVTDSGPGIRADRIERLFVAFDRLGAEATAVEGTGLGLTLSRYLIEAMGGTIGVESTVDVGSAFWVELPLADEPTHPLDEADREPAGSARRAATARTVLYIEDNLANLSLMERILVGRFGFRLLAAMQGSLGLDLANDHHPDIILLDLHLPDMPGSEVFERLQHNPATRDIPVVVVSADATPGQVSRLRAAGARAYITKPFDLKQLFETLDSLFPDAN